MIGQHGKQRFATCPQHEDTATQQAWRTARDWLPACCAESGCKIAAVNLYRLFPMHILANG